MTDFFKGVAPVRFEGPSSTNPLAYRHYNKDELVLGKRGVTADTALRLARRFETTPQLWMHLQADWDLHEALNRETAA